MTTNSIIIQKGYSKEITRFTILYSIPSIKNRMNAIFLGWILILVSNNILVWRQCSGLYSFGVVILGLILLVFPIRELIQHTKKALLKHNKEIQFDKDEIQDLSLILRKVQVEKLKAIIKQRKLNKKENKKFRDDMENEAAKPKKEFKINKLGIFSLIIALIPLFGSSSLLKDIPMNALLVISFSGIVLIYVYYLVKSLVMEYINKDKTQIDEINDLLKEIE